MVLMMVRRASGLSERRCAAQAPARPGMPNSGPSASCIVWAPPSTRTSTSNVVVLDGVFSHASGDEAYFHEAARLTSEYWRPDVQGREGSGRAVAEGYGHMSRSEKRVGNHQAVRAHLA